MKNFFYVKDDLKQNKGQGDLCGVIFLDEE